MRGSKLAKKAQSSQYLNQMHGFKWSDTFKTTSFIVYLLLPSRTYLLATITLVISEVELITAPSQLVVDIDSEITCKISKSHGAWGNLFLYCLINHEKLTACMKSPESQEFPVNTWGNLKTTPVLFVPERLRHASVNLSEEWPRKVRNSACSDVDLTYIIGALWFRYISTKNRSIADYNLKWISLFQKWYNRISTGQTPEYLLRMTKEMEIILDCVNGFVWQNNFY